MAVPSLQSLWADLANTAPLRWGFLPCDSAFLFIPALVGVCQFAVNSCTPPRGGPSAIARAPPAWAWVKPVPPAHQRGGFSCYRSCPPSWESVPTKISPFRWESVTLAQLPSPTSVGVSRLRLTIPANVGVFPDSPSFSPSWGWIQYWPNKPHPVGVYMYYLNKPMYPLSSKEIVSATFL
jgi:hypothetical protein